MNLAEVKKLKVADLRAKLQERGLDSKGLKAELVERLMCAIEAESRVTAPGQPEDKGPAGDDPGVQAQDGSVLEPSDPVEATQIETTGQPPTKVAEVTATVRVEQELAQVREESAEGSVASQEPSPAPEPGVAELSPEIPTVSESKQGNALEQAAAESSPPRPVHPMAASAQETGTTAPAEKGSSPESTQVHDKHPEAELKSASPSVGEGPSEATEQTPQQRSDRSPQDSAIESDQAPEPRTGVAASPHKNAPSASQVECHAERRRDEQGAKDDLNGSSDKKSTGTDIEADWSIVAEKGSEDDSGSETEKDGGVAQDAQSKGAEAEGGDVERRGVKRPFAERGRGYYEFKEEINYNRARSPEPEAEVEEEVDEGVLRLDSYNCDLHFEVGPDGSSGQSLLSDKFPLLWSGCRLTHGVDQGKTGFEAKFVKKLPVTDLKAEDPNTHVLKVGWSVDNSSFQLGEVEFSYCYDGRGRKMTEGKEEEFGEPFSEDDIIGCYAAFSDAEVELSFHKNGEPLGVAFRVARDALGDRALHPHVLCRNCAVAVNLDSSGATWHPTPPGCTPLPALPPELRRRAPLPPVSKRDCEVLMMVGMPGAGKTHWAQAHMAQNPEKRYNLLGTRVVLNNMKCVPTSGQKEQVLQQATQCLSELIRTAARRRRNYILDQANVYSSAQRRKMQRFRGFQRRAVVVCPEDEEWTRRLALHQQQEGEEVPQMSLLKVKVSFSLPEPGDYLEEVIFPELSRADAEKLLARYKEEARRLLPTPPKRKKARAWRNKPAYPGPAGPPGRNREWGHGWNRGGYNPRPYGQPSFWGPQRREDYRPFPNQYRAEMDRFHGRDFNQQRYRDYQRQYSGEWNSYYQDQGYYGNRNYGHGGYRGYW